MAYSFRRTRWVAANGRRVSEEEAARRIALGEKVERREGRARYLSYLDESGRRKVVRSHAPTKTEADKRANELEQRAERVRLGLQVGLPPDGGGTLQELLTAWLESREGSPSYATEKGTVRKHLLPSDLAPLPLTQVTTGRIEMLLRRLDLSLAPQTVNHVRGYLIRAFNDAIKLGRWPGPNPALAVGRRTVPERLPDYLRSAEVVAVIESLEPQWRPLFATAIHTGLRKGELFALRKTDVDLEAGLIRVSRSHGRDMTKGKRAKAIPISTELAPFLRAAIEASPSALVFPGADGERRSKNTKMPNILRTAMDRAGIVEGYRFVCRAKVNAEGKRDRLAPQCTHVEVAKDSAPRRCPLHGYLLWPTGVVRRIRFHDTRHTAGSHLFMNGANPAAVQRILRHSDPRITTNTYGHLAPEYLRAEVDRVKFGLTVEAMPAAAPATEVAQATACGGVVDSVVDQSPGSG